VSRSVITLTLSTVPYGANAADKSSWVVWKFRFPTKIFVTLLLLQEDQRSIPVYVENRTRRSGTGEARDSTAESLIAFLLLSIAVHLHFFLIRKSRYALASANYRC